MTWRDDIERRHEGKNRKRTKRNTKTERQREKKLNKVGEK